MDVRQLRYFVRVVELRSVSRAAEALHIAQPALGAQIRKLEDELQTQLLFRHSRGVEPTEAGLLLQGRALAILQGVEEAKHAVRDLAGPSLEIVDIGITPCGYPRIASTLIRGDWPNAEIVVRETMNPELFEWIRSDRVDFGLVYLTSHWPDDLETELLSEESAVFVQGRSAAEPSTLTIPFASVCRHPILIAPKPHHIRAMLQEAAERRGYELNVAYEVQSLSTLIEMVEQNVAAAILPLGAVAQYLDAGRLVARTIVDPLLPVTFALVRSPRRPWTKTKSLLGERIRELVASAAGPAVARAALATS